MSHETSRRQFLKTSSTLTAGAALVSGLSIAQSAHAAGSDEIKLALIGCGGRGRGAIRQRIGVGDNCKVVAVADAFEDGANRAARDLRRDGENADSKQYKKVDLPEDRVFNGLDAYKKAIDCLSPGDQVVVATPPGFRPYHYRYAVEKGLHVFMEKPVCIDAPGFNHIMESNKIAEEKNLKVCVGFQRHADPKYYNWINQIHAGKIGDVQFTRVYWNGGFIWCRPRRAGENEMNFQVNNWYHFVWLCGENIVEQHVHNIDIGNWIHGKGDRMAHPVKANAQGGRTFKAGPVELLNEAPPFADRGAWDEWYQKNRERLNRHGQAWDHFFVEYTYADDSKMFSQCRHQNRTWSPIGEHVHGTEGSGQPGQLNGKNGEWRNDEKVPKGEFEWEHDLHVKAIREDSPKHDGYFAAMSCMTAILGREAAFSGQEITWDDLVKKGKSYHPNGEITSFDQIPPVQPDANGFYESTVPVPGSYSPFA